jgi:hypothetical protein
LCLGVVLAGLEVNYQIGLDGEDGVGDEVWVVVGVDLGCYWLVVVVGDLQGQELAWLIGKDDEMRGISLPSNECEQVS